jgi:hypothetical protein
VLEEDLLDDVEVMLLFDLNFGSFLAYVIFLRLVEVFRKGMLTAL